MDTLTTKAAPTPAQQKKRARRAQGLLRAAIQLVFFVLAPSLFTSTFTAVKQFFTAVGASAPLHWTGFAAVFTALCGFTVLFGRFFCGYACAFGSLGDAVYGLSSFLRKRAKKKPLHLPKALTRVLRYLPYLILTAIVLLCALGVYGSFTGWSPWDVFSMATTLHLRLSGYALGALLLVLILIGMAVESRFFCRFLCPMGAVFRLLPILPWAVLGRDRESCLKGCSACTRNCPMDVELGVGQNAGDCIRCGKCTGACPKENIRATKHLRGNELWLTACKALLLLGAAWLRGAVRFF